MVQWDIFSVGFPTCLEAIIISFVTIFINSLLVVIDGNMAVAAYGVIMRIFSVFVTPITGIGVANITVVGTAFGAKLKDNIITAFNYSNKISLILAMFAFLILFFFSSNLAGFFASDASSDITIYIINAMYILAFTIFTIPVREIAFSMLQAMGKGVASMCLIIIKESIFTSCSYSFAFFLGMGSYGIYYGMLVGDIIGSLIVFVYLYVYIKRLDFN